MYYYSAKANGFYHADIHGGRTKLVPDPDWKRPTRKVLTPAHGATPDRFRVPHPHGIKGKDGKVLQIWVDDPDWKHPMIETDEPDHTIDHQMIEVENRECCIPPDAVEVPDAEHRALLEAQSRGKRIVPNAHGYPVVSEPLQVAPEQQWEIVRTRRDNLLRGSDWTHFADSPLDPSKRAEWSKYRQALRDVTKQRDPFHIKWPVSP